MHVLGLSVCVHINVNPLFHAFFSGCSLQWISQDLWSPTAAGDCACWSILINNLVVIVCMYKHDYIIHRNKLELIVVYHVNCLNECLSSSNYSASKMKA